MNGLSIRLQGRKRTRRTVGGVLLGGLSLLLLSPAANAQDPTRQQQTPNDPPVRTPPVSRPAIPPPAQNRIIISPVSRAPGTGPLGNGNGFPHFDFFFGQSLYPELPTAFNGGGRRYPELPTALNGGGRRYPELPTAFDGQGLYPELPTAFNSGTDVLSGSQTHRSVDSLGFPRFRRSRDGYFFHHGLARYRSDNDVFITYGIAGVPDYTFYYPQWGGYYFPDNWAYYPNYYPSYVGGVTVISPYGIYLGVNPPYIGLNSVVLNQPQYIYVPVPVYTPGGDYRGWRQDDVDSYYLNRNQDSQAPVQDKALEATVNDIKTAWRNRDVDALSKHLRHDGKIAVTLRGKYQYSLDPGDYLDMTRDAFRTTKTVSFELDSVQRKENGVYAVAGRHVYEDKDGSQHTVHISYVLEKTDDEYDITQVGTAPDRIEEQPQ